MISMNRQSVQPCGGEITEQVVGKLGRTGSRYCPISRMRIDDLMGCKVERLKRCSC